MITPEQLTEIDALTEAAEPGPWKHIKDFSSSLMCYVCASDVPSKCGPEGYPVCMVTGTDASAEFIAAARTNVPLLTAEIRRLQESITVALDGRDETIRRLQAEVQRIQPQLQGSAQPDTSAAGTEWAKEGK